MEAESKRLDHLGIIKGTIDDLGLIELINECIGIDPREEINVGEAVAGMILNGLGFVSKPLSLAPIFFKNQALNVLFDKEIEAEHFNYNKLGRSLDKLYSFGLERLFFILSSNACNKVDIDTKFKSLDTTSLSLTGEYDNCSDEHTVKVVHGYSKDHRPDLKQIIQELVVSQDGGVPLMMKTLNGNENDNKIFKERTKELLNNLTKLEQKNDFLIGDSKLYCLGNIENLSAINFISRIPNSISLVKDKVKEAHKIGNEWVKYDDDLSYQCLLVEHYGINQRWHVCFSESSKNRAIKSFNKLLIREKEKLLLEKNKLFKEKFCSKQDAIDFMDKLKKKLKLHTITNVNFTTKGYYNKKGKPKKGSAPDYHAYHIEFDYEVDTALQQEYIEEKSCFVISTNATPENISSQETLTRYKNQNQAIENMGFRFLKDPLFFTSSLFVKKESRIEGLVFIMTLSLLVYSIAQRQLQKKLLEKDETIPNQINKDIKNPTLRWVFQLFEGVNHIKVKISDKIHSFLDGMNDLRWKIIKLFGGKITEIYKRAENIMLVT